MVAEFVLELIKKKFHLQKTRFVDSDHEFSGLRRGQLLPYQWHSNVLRYVLYQSNCSFCLWRRLVVSRSVPLIFFFQMESSNKECHPDVRTLAETDKFVRRVREVVRAFHSTMEWKETWVRDTVVLVTRTSFGCFSSLSAAVKRIGAIWLRSPNSTPSTRRIRELLGE